MISIIVSIMNRTSLLKWGLQGVMNLCAFTEKRITSPLELNLCDSGSTDGLDAFLGDFSKAFPGRVNKWFLDEAKSPYHKEFNCPALIYNTLVKLSSYENILKLDPEFVFITPEFMNKALDILFYKPAIVMPLPHHTHHFDFNSLEEIQRNYKSYEYSTHITKDTASTRNVYYGCMFSKQAFEQLGGIDVRFMNGIGSEDDHMMDQWRRKYGADNVITLLEEEGVHLWHGEWGKGVPQQYYPWVNLNAQLRQTLQNTPPNNGDFGSIQWPELQLTSWSAGKKIIDRQVFRL